MPEHQCIAAPRGKEKKKRKLHSGRGIKIMINLIVWLDVCILYMYGIYVYSGFLHYMSVEKEGCVHIHS